MITPLPGSASSTAMTPVETGRSARCYRFGAFNTTCSLHLASNNERREEAFVATVVDWVRDFQAKYSRFDPASLLSRLNANTNGAWTGETRTLGILLDLAEKAWQLSGGRVDVTTLPLTELWHSDPGKNEPAADAIEQARRSVGFDKIQRKDGCVRLPHPGMKLDFGGLGKEYAVDFAASLAREQGFENFLISFGGDMRAKGHPPGKSSWDIALEGAESPGQFQMSVRLTAGGVATSGHTRRMSQRGGRRVSHLIDPRSGYPATAVAAATVVAGSSVAAGLMARAACLCHSLEEALAFLELRRSAAIVFTPDCCAHRTAAWQQRFADATFDSRQSEASKTPADFND